MDGLMRRHWGIFWLLVALTSGCQSREPVASLPDASAILEAAGKRLSQSVSESRLTAAAGRAQELLALLRRRERDGLGRSYLKFQTSVPVVVEVAAPSSSIPFWLADQHFEPSTLRLDNADARWTVFRKSFPPGWVGLGVDGLDRTPPAHYVVFLHAEPGSPPISRDAITLGPGSRDGWLLVDANPGVTQQVT